ncbi:MAG: hypothetical protein H7X86_05880 [Gorillibacterium sp.]|nr:hypothetical protein [Gorillibacterium sp.]
MTMINHINRANESNEVYCCLRNKVVCADEEHQNRFCSGCKMFQRNAQGGGVECRWEDSRTGNDRLVINDPFAEWAFNQKKTVSSPTSITDFSYEFIVVNKKTDQVNVEFDIEV